MTTSEKRRPGRKPLDGQAMTNTERTQRRRERLAQEAAAQEAAERAEDRRQAGIVQAVRERIAWEIEQDRPKVFFVMAHKYGTDAESLIVDTINAEIDRLKR